MFVTLHANCNLKIRDVKRYHASPQSTLVTDAFLTGPTENTQLLVVVLTSAKESNMSIQREKRCLETFLNLSSLKMFYFSVSAKFMELHNVDKCRRQRIMHTVKEWEEEEQDKNKLHHFYFEQKISVLLEEMLFYHHMN